MKEEFISNDFNFSDNDAVEYKNQLVKYLTKKYDNFSTHAMSDYQLYRQGKKEMILEIKNFIENETI